MKLDQVIKDYRLTEKANLLSANLNQYTFVVNTKATRTDVARAVAAHFKKKVASVNILRVRGKAKASRTNRAIVGTTSPFKKAVVTLAKGEKIELL